MMRLFEFSDDEWESVRSAPWIVGTAVITADDGSPFSVLREIEAVDRRIEDASRASDRMGLVESIARELRNAPATSPVVDPSRLEDWNTRLNDVLTIVDAKAPDADARDFREWLYDIATDTADAARDGWRVRGPRVSTEERDLLEELADVLGVG